MVRHGLWSSAPWPGRSSKGRAWPLSSCWSSDVCQHCSEGSCVSLLSPRPGCLRVCCCALEHRAPLHLLTLALGTAGWPGRMKGRKGGRKEALDKTWMTVLGKWPCHQCWSVIFVLGKLCMRGELDRACGRR